MRRLLCTERTVPLNRLDEYARAWADLRHAAGERQCRAWRFRHARDHGVGLDTHATADLVELPDAARFLEFVEWRGQPAPVPLEIERNALDHAFGRARSTVWEEADPS